MINTLNAVNLFIPVSHRVEDESGGGIESIFRDIGCFHWYLVHPVNYYIPINSITFKQIQFKKAEVISLARLRIILYFFLYVARDANSASHEKCIRQRNMKRREREKKNTTIGVRNTIINNMSVAIYARMQSAEFPSFFS